jgi:2-succinyl-5-enolpyruvyl-6-hydroxy-3-cyclohexene-1-carboxylate synthase
VLSKNLKVFLRKYSPKAHWHIQQAGAVVDVFQNLTRVIRSTPQRFFKTVSQFSRTEDFENQKQNNYNKLWEIEERRAQRCITEFFPNKDFAELELVREILSALPANCNLHLANSMSVRYANFIGLTAAQSGVQVFSNRGTSGIDGCTSTAIGHCLADDKKPNILITGDLAFFYDRNAFWNNYPTPNLRIALLNNHGGLIFKIIDGPGTLPETDEYFVTTQKLNAKCLCEEFGISHLALDLKRKLKNLLKDFFDFDGATKILELESTSSVNKTIFDNFKLKIKKAYDL